MINYNDDIDAGIDGCGGGTGGGGYTHRGLLTVVL